AEIEGFWSRRQHKQLRRCLLDAAERHGKRSACAEQIAIFHPLPPAANTPVTMVVLPPFCDICHPGDRYQLVFAAKAKPARKTIELRHLCNDSIVTRGIRADTAATFPQQPGVELRRSPELPSSLRNRL
ncbi:MAG: hypothetical protein ACREFN_05325, partial [Acetobacteraceae bacterium]